MACGRLGVHISSAAFRVANGNPPDTNVQLASSTDFSNSALHIGYDVLLVLGSSANNRPCLGAGRQSMSEDICL
jgi:hypothetical protein